MQQASSPKSSFRRTTETYKSGAKTLPQGYFVSPELFAKEQQKIFGLHWVLVGHQSELDRPGSYLLADIAGESVIVVREQSGTIRSFYNVCRHRGTRLCEEKRGQVRAIQCPYHAWTYALNGQLIGAPHMDEVPGFDKTEYSLQPLNTGVWEGFIFVNLGTTSTPAAPASQSVREPDGCKDWFAPLTGKFSHWNLSNLRSAKRIEYDVKANWKLIFENYSECYHCPGVHPGLSKLSPYDSAENDLSEGPFLGGFMKINPGRSLTMSGNACAIPVRADKAVQEEADRAEQVFYYSIFPNMLLSMHPDYVMVHQLWPQAPNRTLICCDWFFHPDAVQGRQPQFNPTDAVEFWDMTNKQDWHVCELSQQGIVSRAYQPGPYSSRESIPAAWDRFYLQIMG